MTEEVQSETAQGFDPILLQRMMGELGDAPSLEKLSEDLAGIYIEFLPDVFQTETGLGIEVTFEEYKAGLKEELIAGLGETVALTDASLRGWCTDFTFGCGSTFVMTTVEALLGAPPETIEPPQERALSKIELDLADMIFQKMASVLRSVVLSGASYEAVLTKPYNAPNRPKPAEGYKDPNAVLVSMRATLGKTEALLHVIVPQRSFLKSKFATPKNTSAARVKKEWTDQIKEQVQRSQVSVEARIKLESLSLGTISRLQVGDVIPFSDGNDVRVEVNANGKELYFGEFGRSGAKYTVRITDTYTTESDFLEHLMG